jgi:hypothetical protein
MRRVTPIALTNVAWQHYVNSSTELLGRAPTSGVDRCSSKLSDFAKYTASLAEFVSKEEVDARRVLRRPGPHLRHTFYSVLISESPGVVLKIAEGSDLDVISAPAGKSRAAVVSGNLDCWRNAVLTFCNPATPKTVRELFNEVKTMFDQLGLADIFHGYSTVNQRDGTFALEYKP